MGTALLLLAASVAAGAINSVAGGGTLLTFPSLLAVGLAPLTANATSSVSLVPGSLSSVLGYRKELGGEWRVAAAMIPPSLLGGWLGAQLALWSSDALFAKLVPWLILGATVLFVWSDRLRRFFAPHSVEGAAQGPPTTRRLLVLSAIQLAVSIYGGYFGAGMGILMLAALGMAGETNLHRMNALKGLAGTCINAMGTITFIVGGRVQWRLALLMAGGAIVGGYGGAGLAQRVGQGNVRRAVIAIGFAMAGWTLYRQIAA